jgi:3-deoxy-D-manno-octulosonate 8-phosphate phosphatase KdsC-like HAD superfamily phosphatase
MNCCDEAENTHWTKGVFREGLCIRAIRAKRITYLSDQVAYVGDYIVRIPALNVAFVMKPADYDKWYEPLVEEEHAD